MAPAIHAMNQRIAHPGTCQLDIRATKGGKRTQVYTRLLKSAQLMGRRMVRDKQTSESGANKEVDSNLKLDN